MDINISSQKNVIMIVAALLLVLGLGYYFIVMSPQAEDVANTNIDKSLLIPKIITYLNAKDGIDLKDSSFLKSSYYSQLLDYSETIPMSPKRGRDNPFIPYVAPGSIR